MNNLIVGSNYQTYKKSNEAIESFIKRDQETIDLASYLKASGNDRYSTDNSNVFLKHAVTEFPEILKRDVEKCKMGFLPAINHIWVSTGSLLCLWNYVEKTEIFRYECNETVQNVELLKFSNQVVELMISTSNHIFLHGLDYQADQKLKIISSSQVHSDGVIMSNFITTDTRRAFMQGDDGHLYELNTIADKDGLTISCKIQCHTASPILRYTSYFFKSVPKASVKSMVVDNASKYLYFLLSDSSIHSVNIQGSSYLPMQKYNATNLESIHLISKVESKEINLMAVSNTGDRLYFSCKNNTIDLVYTRSSPPLPGSLLFNNLTKELCELSFYHHGVFASIHVKSEKKYLVLTAANSIRDGYSNPILLEDVYSELISKKIWSIIEDSPSESTNNNYFKHTFELPETPSRQFSTLSASGITHYIKQRPIDYLSDVFNSNDPNAMSNFLHRYGAVETCALCFLFACSSESSSQAVQFLRGSPEKDEGLLLFFSNVIQDIWSVDIMKKSIPKEQFAVAQKRLQKLLPVLELNITIKLEIIDLIVRTVGGISFVSFIHNQEWDTIRTMLLSTSTSCSFSDLVTSEEGAILSRELVLATIKSSTLGNRSNQYIYISSFLDSNCSHLLGDNNIIYYKGAECLQSAHHLKDNAEALKESLSYFKQIITLIDLDSLQAICEENCKLQNHHEAIELIFAKYQAESVPNFKIYDILFATISDSFQHDDEEENYSRSVIESALRLTNEVQFHYKIYNWLLQNHHNSVLVTLDTPLLVKYIKSQLIYSESLACLSKYHYYRKEYRSYVDCLVELATKTTDLEFAQRLACLRKACAYLPEITDMSNEEKNKIELIHSEAIIQLDMYYALSEIENTKAVAEKLVSGLKPAKVLLDQYAYKYDLHEDALYLINLLEHFNYGYVKKAWKIIIEECETKEELKSKLTGLTKSLYPSVTAFPVYTIYSILEKQYSDFAKILFMQAGISEEIINDAQKVLSAK